MTSDFGRLDTAAVLEQVQEQMRQIARVQRERVQLTASATVRKRVTVTVNADGMIIETKFAPGIEDLSFGEIAKAVTAAAQQATAEVARKGQELMAPLQERRSRLPKLSDLLEDMPDLDALRPEAPPVPTTPPHAEVEEPEGAPMEFDDVDTTFRTRADDRGVTDSGW
ncbi:YbaB/EbfC family nucleoid-associated protein [Nocardia arthritidis]|nr:YbaB/EbfC family nucleoid-associated protein [Nocardia arthritidis]